MREPGLEDDAPPTPAVATEIAAKRSERAPPVTGSYEADVRRLSFTLRSIRARCLQVQP